MKPEVFGKVGVLMGGWSVERDVSLLSGKMVCDGLQKNQIDAHPVDVGKDIANVLMSGDFDRVFNILHGRGGEDGTIQGLLEVLEIPYTGSGVTASALAMDKVLCKNVWQAHGLPLAEHAVVDDATSLPRIGNALGFPLMLKPVAEGSSVGVSKVNDEQEFSAAYAEHGHLGQLMAERYIDGDEYTITILGGEALPVIRLETNNSFYDYEAKYLTDDTRYHIPCGLDKKQEIAMQELAINAFDVLGARGCARVDVMRDRDDNNYLIELNTQPGMTDHSLVPKAAAAVGISYADLVTKILLTSLSGEQE